MKLKQRAADFKVRELLLPEVISGAGEHRVYRVTKRKLTSIEAAAALAAEAGVRPGEVALVGMKDRQGVTTQHMSLRGGPSLSLRGPNLRVETIGCARQELSGAVSAGNAFEIAVRALDRRELQTLRVNLPVVREHGCINYFDDQRFGNLRHNQGWIALELMRGRREHALRTLLAAESFHDDTRNKAFKSALRKGWGNWKACLGAARRFGEHHSVFEHLLENPTDFAGAFRFVASRLRLIHLYAFQSHLWNRAVAELLKTTLPLDARATMRSREGLLVHHHGVPPFDPSLEGRFRMPGPGLEDVSHPVQRALLEKVLEAEGLKAEQLRIEGVGGFQLKGEDRDLILAPQHLRVRPAERDPLNPGLEKVDIRFELPPGTYATLVVGRLLVPQRGEAEAGERSFPPASAARGGQRGAGPGGGAGGQRRDRGPRDGRRGPPPRKNSRRRGD